MLLNIILNPQYVLLDHIIQVQIESCIRRMIFPNLLYCLHSLNRTTMTAISIHTWLAKTCQYGGLTILGVEGYKRLRNKFRKH